MSVQPNRESGLAQTNQLKQQVGRHIFHPMLVSDDSLSSSIMLRSIVNKFVTPPPLILTEEQADIVVPGLDHAQSTTPR